MRGALLLGVIHPLKPAAERNPARRNRWRANRITTLKNARRNWPKKQKKKRRPSANRKRRAKTRPPRNEAGLQLLFHRPYPTQCYLPDPLPGEPIPSNEPGYINLGTSIASPVIRNVPLPRAAIRLPGEIVRPGRDDRPFLANGGERSLRSFPGTSPVKGPGAETDSRGAIHGRKRVDDFFRGAAAGADRRGVHERYPAGQYRHFGFTGQQGVTDWLTAPEIDA